MRSVYETRMQEQRVRVWCELVTLAIWHVQVQYLDLDMKCAMKGYHSPRLACSW